MNKLSIINTAMHIMCPLLFASLGGLYTLLVGSLNIALEAYILISAFTVASMYFITGNILLSIIIAIIVTMIFAIIQSLINIKLKSNIFIVGVGLNIFALAITNIVSIKLFNHKGVIFTPELNMESLLKNSESGVPIIGDIFFGYNIFVYLSWALCILSYILLYKTPFGLRLRSIGIDIDSALSSNINIVKYKIIAYCISAIFCSLAGIYLFISISSYTPSMSAGKGWIALVIIFLAHKKIPAIFIVSFLFAISDAFSNYAQAIFNIPSEFILAIPFIISFALLVIYAMIKKKNYTY